jgi:hypothetical protein
MITLTAAYGRKYTTEAEAMAAWKSGLDFKILNGPYCSIRDIDMIKAQFGHIVIRYGNWGDYRYATIWESQMHKILGGLTTEIT